MHTLPRDFHLQLAMQPDAAAEPSLESLLLAPAPRPRSAPLERAEGHAPLAPAGASLQLVWGHQLAATEAAEEAIDLASPSLLRMSPEERRALLARQAAQAEQLRCRRDEQQRWCAAAQRLLHQAGTAGEGGGRQLDGPGCCPEGGKGGPAQRAQHSAREAQAQAQAAAEAAAAAELQCKRVRAHWEAAQLRQAAEWEARRAHEQRRWEARRAHEQAQWEAARRREQADWQAAQAAALQRLQRQLAELERGPLPPLHTGPEPAEQLGMRGSAPACLQQSDWWRSGGTPQPQPRPPPPPAAATSPAGFRFERSLTSTDRSARGTRSMEGQRSREPPPGAASSTAALSRKRRSEEAGMAHVVVAAHHPFAAAAPPAAGQSQQDWDLQTHAWMAQHAQHAQQAALLHAGRSQTASPSSRHSIG
jgi:hypothetical protein